MYYTTKEKVEALPMGQSSGARNPDFLISRFGVTSESIMVCSFCFRAELSGWARRPPAKHSGVKRVVRVRPQARRTNATGTLKRSCGSWVRSRTGYFESE